MIRTLLVDDVALAREKLARMLAAHADIAVIAEASRLEEAVRRADAGDIDLVFLDIGLPDGSGLALVERLRHATPYIVFVTAYPEHALRSYDLGALDYLLKPLDVERLDVCLARVRERVAGARVQAGPPRICVSDGGRTEYLVPSDIDYLDVAGHYVCLHVDRRVHLLRDSLARLATLLAPHGFARVHRSAAVNLERVAVLRARRNGDADLVLRDGTVLPLSRSFRAELERRLPPRS